MDALARLRAFLLPAGDEAVQHIRAVRLDERGEMRSAPNAKWIAFEARTLIRADRNEFRWQARFRGMTVEDAYAGGKGSLQVRVARVIPVKSFAGPETDIGELQRYLSSISLCPPMLLWNESLLWEPRGANAVRVLDRESEVAVTLELGDDGDPQWVHAVRPRIAGKSAIPTPWRAACSGFVEWEGLRVARRLDARWCLPEGEFVYYRADVTGYTVAESVTIGE